MIMRNLLILLLAALATSTPLTAQTAEDCPAAQVWAGKQYQLNAEQLYVHSSAAQGYDVLPIWEAQQATVTQVQCREEKNGKSYIRVYVTLEGGTEAYFEVAQPDEIGRYLQASITLN